jgi:hypothetical protein
MKPFVHDDFLLESDLARHLYHDRVAGLPIIDYHCHLPVGHLARDHPTPATGRSSRRGRAPCPRPSATRSTTGPTWS